MSSGDSDRQSAVALTKLNLWLTGILVFFLLIVASLLLAAYWHSSIVAQQKELLEAWKKSQPVSTQQISNAESEKQTPKLICEMQRLTKALQKKSNDNNRSGSGESTNNSCD